MRYLISCLKISSCEYENLHTVICVENHLLQYLFQVQLLVAITYGQILCSFCLLAIPFIGHHLEASGRFIHIRMRNFMCKITEKMDLHFSLSWISRKFWSTSVPWLFLVYGHNNVIIFMYHIAQPRITGQLCYFYSMVECRNHSRICSPYLVINVWSGTFFEK